MAGGEAPTPEALDAVRSEVRLLVSRLVDEPTLYAFASTLRDLGLALTDVRRRLAALEAVVWPDAAPGEEPPPGAGGR
jgi:hypothetical protein